MLRLAILFTAMLVTPALASAQSIEGVWLMTEIEDVGGPNAGVTPAAQARLLMYTKSHFMWAFDNGAPARTPISGPGADASDAEWGRFARQYQSSGGTYRLDGSTITYIHRVSLVPNTMLPENQTQVRQIRTLTPTFLETQVTNPDGVTTILRYRRVE